MPDPREVWDFYGYSGQSDIVVDLDTREVVRGVVPPINWGFVLCMLCLLPFMALELVRTWRGKNRPGIGQCETALKDLERRGR